MKNKMTDLTYSMAISKRDFPHQSLNFFGFILNLCEKMDKIFNLSSNVRFEIRMLNGYQRVE